MNTEVEQDRGPTEDDQQQQQLPVLAIAFGITAAGTYLLVDTVLRSEGGFRLALVAGLLISASLLWALVRARAVAWLACGAALFLAWVAVTVPVGERFGAPFTDLSVVHPVYLPLALLLLALAAAVVARSSIVLAWAATATAAGIWLVLSHDHRAALVLVPAFGAIELVRRSGRRASPPGSRLATALFAPTVAGLVWLPRAIGEAGYVTETGGEGSFLGFPILVLTVLALLGLAGGWWAARARVVALTLVALALATFLLAPTDLVLWFFLYVVWPLSYVIVALGVLAVHERSGPGSLSIAVAAAVVVHAIGVQLEWEVTTLLIAAVVGVLAATFPAPFGPTEPASTPAGTRTEPGPPRMDDSPDDRGPNESPGP